MTHLFDEEMLGAWRVRHVGYPGALRVALNEREVYYPERVMSDSGDGSERSVRTW